MAYLLDSNVFIEAKRLHYGFDFCPAFWDWLDLKSLAGEVRSISRVADELVGRGDDLAEWAEERVETFFRPPEPALLPALAQVSAWATNGSFQQSAVGTFLQVADSFLVASALSSSHTVVTHEIPSTSVNKIKIPTACVALGVKYMSPFAMLRREQARFVLGS